MRTTFRVAFLATLLFPLAFVSPSVAGPAPAADGTSLDVPYLPQTEDLCGGAAAAMLFRYWGERHAGVQEFASLVDRRAGGIADVDLVDAIRKRHWSAVRIDGSVEALRRELLAGRPPMLLLEDRPQRYHYVIAVGIDDEAVYIHDPTWGPSRRLPLEKLQAAWKPSGFWTLRVTPTSNPTAASTSNQPKTSAVTPAVSNTTSNASSSSSCDRQLDAALDEIAKQGIERADDLLSPVIAACPDDAGPRRELAGVRFAQRRFSDAAALAESALARDAHDRYAADVLGSSRFMLNDFDAALRAWNMAGTPMLDSIRISGLSRTRYALVAQALDLPEGALLTSDAFRLARRRLESLPDVSSSRLSLRPDEDGFIVTDVAVVEQPTLPRNPIQWAAASAQAAIERQVSLRVPGRTGQGETWSASWGWWENRPRFSGDFAAPLLSGPRGVWRVSTAWEAQTYGRDASSAVREERLGGDAGLSSWLTPNLRVDVSAGIDTWTRATVPDEKTVHVGGEVERRLLNDHVSAQVSLARWMAFRSAPGFGTASVDVSLRSHRTPAPLVAIVSAGASLATADAPLALFSGAGEGRSRAPLLRAHGLLRQGRVEGPVFGRKLAHATVELQHWLPKPGIVRIGAAGFADAASAAGRPSFVEGAASQVDVGAGLRVRVPGRSGLFRVDYARGLRDGAATWIIGWQAE